MLPLLATCWLAAPPAGEIERNDDAIAPVEIVAPGAPKPGAPKDTAPPSGADPSASPEQPAQPEPEPEQDTEQPPTESPADPPAPNFDDDDIPYDEDLEEDTGEGEVREILVDASVLGKASALDVFTHAGGRDVIDQDEARERGATSVNEALERTPGVRTTQGNSGLGSQDTKLQVAVRGVSPRLSSRATVLLDEIPIAPAPYGQPQLSLFPLSLFSIAKIDVVRGGATARYGPQTAGGVFNLISHPIPAQPSISVFAQGDSNLDFSLGGAYGATHGRFGMYLEYAPRLGQSWREHSDKQVHGGLAKFAWQFNPRLRLESISHAYHEVSELPGGLSRAAYDEDPFQSLRPFDEFTGWRAGTALKLGWQPSERQDVKISAWYNHSYRSSAIASNAALELALVDQFVERPRIYDVAGVEPRWSMGFDHPDAGLSQQLSVGARAAFEIAELYTYTTDVGGRLLTADDDARTSAYAAYVNDKLVFLDGDLSLDLGVRMEFIKIVRRSNLESFLLSPPAYWAPLPAASLWYAPIDELALFLAYGRSFGPPQYLQLLVAPDDLQLQAETSNGVELGAKLLELAGLYGEVTGWYKEFTNYIDVGEESYDAIPKIHIWGVESELEWYPSEVFDADFGEPTVYAGYAWTGSYLMGLTYTGNKMPWYPEHEAWAGGSWGFDFGLELGVDVSYQSRQYTDLENREVEDQDTAAYGPIPAYTLVNLWTRMKTPLPRGWRLEFTGGIKNIADVRYFSRTDDRNAGILVGRPRTFYLNMGFAHDFLPTNAREPRKRRRRREMAWNAGF
ncbi:TonB-dependent receptor [Pseudenhygromyxa sp. WMMC2535]|uniref:TonB-dependent receptor domain-containing protein n=1 Tax=Pseudenhygromyxa sp. WMMC2535 TaxID=2712867 RepID=UPI001554BB55|nr:TonB-dependent receptor [Pseudenhygromyxa sp. WMMC2535]NVB43337.1 TonB-dependent receptor [Pseudenhygromyxa sp. WMMC2535]